MVKRLKRVEYNINKSEYYFRINKLTFFFSSQFNKNRFESGFIDYVNDETNKLKAKYKVNINLSDYLMVAYYKKIEKRGFRIVYKINEKETELSEEVLLANQILMK